MTAAQRAIREAHKQGFSIHESIVRGRIVLNVSRRDRKKLTNGFPSKRIDFPVSRLSDAYCVAATTIDYEVSGHSKIDSLLG